jgi:DNA-binding IclR family transcriptional regulator
MARVSHYEDKKLRVLAMIAEARGRHSKPPTVRTLAVETGVGVATMHAYLHRLAEEGMVEWSPRQHRSLNLTPQGFQQLSPSAMPST